MYKALRHSKQILEFFCNTMGKILFPILCSFFFLYDKVFLLFYLIAKKIANGTVDFTYNGMAQNEYGWWKITNGTVDFSFNGIASNQYGYWVIANGGVDFSYNGEYTYGAYTYNVVNGYAMSDHVHTWNPIYGYRQVDEYGEVPVYDVSFYEDDSDQLDTFHNNTFRFGTLTR